MAKIISEVLKIDPDTQVVRYKDNKYYTSYKLFNMGIWACSECGQLNYMCRDKCCKCREEKFVLVSRERVPSLIGYKWGEYE